LPEKSFRFWYYAWLAWLILITSTTMLFTQPGTLITIAGAISIFAFTFFIPLLWRLNYFLIPSQYPNFAKPKNPWNCPGNHLVVLFDDRSLVC